MNYSLHPLDNKLLLGRYRVVRLLGEGGMGTVHLARVEGAEGFTRPVVVKRMRRDVRATEEGNRLFIREAKILSKMQHPGIVGISDFGVEEGAHIMVLEYVHGYTLAPWLDYRHHKGLPIPIDVCLFITRKVLDALHYAHNFGSGQEQAIEIVHRDVAPDNVLLSNKGYVHLLDFGIASMRGGNDLGTNSGAFRGKLSYGAPELVQGEAATPLSDLYSAAVLCYELLTGIRLFEAEAIAVAFLNMVSVIPDPVSKYRPDVPAALDAVLARALAKDPKARYESALAFSRELRRVQKEDDDEVAELLRRLVQEDFQKMPAVMGLESLELRAAELEKSLSRFPGGMRPATDAAARKLEAAPTVPDGRLEPVVAPATPVNQAPLRGLLWGLLAVGCVIALGLGAAVALLSRGQRDAQVVVVGETPTGALAPAASPSALVQNSGAPVNTPAPSAGGPPVQSLSVAKPGGTSGAAKPTMAPSRGADGNLGAQRSLMQAVAGQSASFQACFSKHLDQTQTTPEVLLHFSVAQAGGVAQVEVSPGAIAASALGKCLHAAASQIHFAPQGDPVSFRVPVRARVSRSNGGS